MQIISELCINNYEFAYWFPELAYCHVKLASLQREHKNTPTRPIKLEGRAHLEGNTKKGALLGKSEVQLEPGRCSRDLGQWCAMEWGLFAL